MTSAPRSAILKEKRGKIISRERGKGKLSQGREQEPRRGEVVTYHHIPERFNKERD